MRPAVEQLLETAMNLPEAEQLEFVTALLSAVEERGLRPFDDTWLEEIQRRSAEYDTGAVQPIPWDQVKERARRSVTGHG
jgi:putative addiction module component (TIGR02574 family)